MTRRTKHPSGTHVVFVQAALALGVLLAGGCKHATQPAGATAQPLAQAQAAPAAYTFTFDFDANGCPVAATASERNCDRSLPANDSKQRKDCLRVRKDDVVTFVANPATAGFLLQFDPFKKGTFSPPPAGIKVDVHGTGKTFTFNVLSDPPEKCPPLDPVFLLD